MEKAEKGFAKQSRHLFLSVTISVLIVGIMFGEGRSLLAAMRPPVAVTVATTDKLAVGQQLTVQVVLQAGDLQDVGFELTIPEGWILVGGQSRWFGSLQAGQPVKFEAYVIPTILSPEPIRGILRVPKWNDTEWRMYMEGGAK